jgi:hypothetical protein
LRGVFAHTLSAPTTKITVRPPDGESNPDFFDPPLLAASGKNGRRKKKQQEVREVQIVVDTLVIVVKSPTLDIGAAERYLRRHRELMTVLKEVIGRILREKPPDPLTLMQDHFVEMQDLSRR